MPPTTSSSREPNTSSTRFKSCAVVQFASGLTRCAFTHKYTHDVHEAEDCTRTLLEIVENNLEEEKGSQAYSEVRVFEALDSRAKLLAGLIGPDELGVLLDRLEHGDRVVHRVAHRLEERGGQEAAQQDADARAHQLVREELREQLGRLDAHRAVGRVGVQVQQVDDAAYASQQFTRAKSESSYGYEYMRKTCLNA